MKTSMEKSRFLRLAFQAQAGDAADHGRLAMWEDKVKCLRGELEASQRSREELARREAQARSHVKALMSQVASLNDVMAVQEAELTSAGAAWEMAK